MRTLTKRSTLLVLLFVKKLANRLGYLTLDRAVDIEAARGTTQILQ